MPSSDRGKRDAAPRVGGVVTSFLLEFLIYPVIFTLWKWHGHLKPQRSLVQAAGEAAEK